jgi:hypothetical protein
MVGYTHKNTHYPSATWNSGTGSTVESYHEYDYYTYTFTEEPDVEVLKASHIHPWREAPNKVRFQEHQAVKVSPAIFDRRPFVNAYKAGRSLGA